MTLVYTHEEKTETDRALTAWREVVDMKKKEGKVDAVNWGQTNHVGLQGVHYILVGHYARRGFSHAGGWTKYDFGE